MNPGIGVQGEFNFDFEARCLVRRVLIQAGLALGLAATLGAAPGQKTSDSARITPVSTLSPAQAGPVPGLQLPVSKPELPKPKIYQEGKASWYGEMFQGKETASGELFDMNDYTAAHRELPLGTWVRVTNLRNNRSVIVRINDRGPVTPGRVLDLSYKAARRLDLHARGVSKVRIEVVKEPEQQIAADLRLGNR